MNRLENLVLQDMQEPLPPSRSVVPYKRVNALFSGGFGAGLRRYAARNLAVRPALAPLALGTVVLTAAMILYLDPLLVGGEVTAKLLSALLLLAAAFQLVVATVRSLLVPLIGLVVAYAGLEGTAAGLLPSVFHPGIFQVAVIGCFLGLVVRCVYRRE